MRHLLNDHDKQRERRTSYQKYFNSSELGVLSTTVNSNPGSVDTGAVGAVREEQKQDFDQNQDSGPSDSEKSSMIIKSSI